MRYVADEENVQAGLETRGRKMPSIEGVHSMTGTGCRIFMDASDTSQSQAQIWTP